ncbi:MAG: S-layer homology domain-containing protein, partial [Dialister sp.]|nr:S-layer homology domain-containing protein [Dialister sp.]MDY5378911.1 S-layer homology domain-containing protein [Dialister sp.]
IMKKILALAAVAALTAGVSAYAANPFSDVTADDWAYQAVSDLSAQGVVEGYPDGTFKGERNMTRYELAQIVARLMAKEDQLNAEQQATIDKLAGEYADELANLGVRVSNLEKKVGNISWAGDAKMMYTNNAKKAGTDTYKGRIRLNVKGQVNDATYVQGRIVTNMWFKDAKPEDGDGNTTMDRLFVNHSFGDKTSVVLGRQDLTVFSGLEYDNAFDGAKLAYNDGKFDAYAAFGQLNAGKFDTEDVAFGGLGYDFGAAKLNAAYFNFVGLEKKTFDSIWGANLVVPVQDFSVFGEYWDSNADKNDNAYQAGLGYSTLDAAKPGTFALNVAYNKVGAGAYLGGTTYDASDFFGAIAADKDLKFWNVFGDVTLQKNVTLHGEYAWDIENADGCDDNAWTVSLNYAF